MMLAQRQMLVVPAIVSVLGVTEHVVLVVAHPAHPAGLVVCLAPDQINIEAILIR